MSSDAGIGAGPTRIGADEAGTDPTDDLDVRREAQDPSTRHPTTPSHLRSLLQWVAVIAVALLIAAGLKSFVVEAFTIPSGSMQPAITIGDRVLVDKLSYDFGRHPHAGDVVVFATPADFDQDATGETNVKDLIKRIIGTPGERLRTAPDGQTILVDDKPLAQPWLSSQAKAHPGPPICSIDRDNCIGDTLTLPPGEYLVMGDNRNDSTDGRYFGPIRSSLLVGRAFVRIWPLSRLGGL